MYFVNQVDFTVFLTELVFRIHQNQTMLGRNLRSAFKELHGILFEQGIIFGRNQSLTDNLLFRDIFVVESQFGFGGRGDYGFFELLMFAHSLGQRNTADGACPGLIVPPRAAGEVSADNHFDGKGFTFMPHGHHRVGRSNFPVRANISRRIQRLGRNLVQDLSFERDSLGQHHVKCRDTVRYDHDQVFVVDVIYVAYFAFVQRLLTVEVHVGLYQCFRHNAVRVLCKLRFVSVLNAFQRPEQYVPPTRVGQYPFGQTPPRQFP